MEKSSQITHFLSLAEPFAYLFLHTLLSWSAKLHKLFTASRQSRPTATQRTEEDKSNQLQLSREDVTTVMSCMGISCSSEDEAQLMGMVGVENMINMFDEEPSLGELKAVFRVFDENCDGFVDAGELMRALGKLGFGELELEECERMVERNSDLLYHKFTCTGVPVQSRPIRSRMKLNPDQSEVE